MNLNNFNLVEELLCLSHKADEIIETEISKDRNYDKFFEEAENRIYEIINRKYSKKDCQINQSTNENVKFRLKKTVCTLIDPRVRIHLRNKNNLNTISEDGKDVSTCKIKTTLSKCTDERNSNAVLDIPNNNSYLDSNGNHIHQEEMKIGYANQEKVEFESGGKGCSNTVERLKLEKFLEEGCRSLNTFSETCSSVNLTVNINDINLSESNVVPRIITQKSFQDLQVLNDQIDEKEVDNKQKKSKTSSQKSNKYKEISSPSYRMTRAKLHGENKMSTSSCDSRCSSEKLSEISDMKNVSREIFDETYVQNSDSSRDSYRHYENGVILETPVFKKNSDPFAVDNSRNPEWGEDGAIKNVKELVKQTRNLDETETLTATKKFPENIPTEKNIEETSLWCCYSPKTKNSAMKNKKSFYPYQKQKSTIELDTKQNPTDVPTKTEASSNITIHGYRLRSLDKQTNERKSSDIIMLDQLKDGQRLRKLVLIKQNNEKNLSDIKNYKPTLAYTVKDIEKQYEEHLYSCDKSEGEINDNFQRVLRKHSNKNIRNKAEDSTRRSESKIQKKNLHEKYPYSSNTENQSSFTNSRTFANNLLRSSKFLSYKYEENFGTKPLERFDGSTILSEEYMKKAVKENIKNEKNTRQVCRTRQICRTRSAPILKRKNANIFGNPRPVTPTEVLNFNQQSLKIKAGEKRKMRELREQETKERRERLEKERKEKIRLREQKRKQRFQRHEEMLKKKIENLKIKSRKWQKSTNKRSTFSSSSEDNKENRAKGNDDLCRNSDDYEESTSYHDVSSKTILGTKTELYSRVSTKQNAVLENPERIHVEISDSSRSTRELNVTYVCHHEEENLQKCETEFVEKVEKLIPSKCNMNHYSKTKIILPKQNTISSKMPLKRKTTYTSANSKAPKLMKYDHVRVLSEQNAVRTQKGFSYGLRSHKKEIQMTNNEEITNTSGSMEHDINVKKSQPFRESLTYQKCSPQTNTARLSKESTDCGKMCFNIKFCKSKKSDKNMLTPPNQNANSHGENCVQTRSMKRILKPPENSPCKVESNKASETRKKKKLTSYRISDFNEDSFDEAKVDKKKIPLWATGVYLKQALIQQYYKPSKSEEEIFGALPKEPVDLTVIFSKNKPEYHTRTSSGEWSTTTTPS